MTAEPAPSLLSGPSLARLDLRFTDEHRGRFQGAAQERDRLTEFRLGLNYFRICG